MNPESQNIKVSHHHFPSLFWRKLYDFALWLYHLGISIASLYSPKAKAWITGRKRVFPRLREVFSTKKIDEKVIWVHCASAGEFESVRTVIDKIKDDYAEIRVLLTFFSPSGMQMHKQYPNADLVDYLPADSSSNASLFLDLVKPQLAIFVRYEFWFHYLHQLKTRRIPAILMSAHFRPEQPFFKWYGSLYRNMLTCFDKILVQDETSGKLLESIGIQPFTASGNPRIDRVLEVAIGKKEIPFLKSFCQGRKVLICGSTWPKDEELILKIASLADLVDWYFILAPHVVEENNILRLIQSIRLPYARYSELNSNSNLEESKVLILDNVGMLASAYRYGFAAYVGGGFGKGIHSILEPAAHGLPVIFGPKNHAFPEASELIRRKGGFEITGEKELQEILNQLNLPDFHFLASSAANEFMQSNRGGTGVAFDEIVRLMKI
jgi:3-deoxy-D-manno-octulosonic-acid transferase